MKTLKKITLVLTLSTLIYSCQSSKQVLSQSDKRMEIMNTIADSKSMSKEMMDIMMKSENGKMMMQEMMQENHAKMMGMMKDNPEMRKSMMSEMMKNNPEMMKEN